MHLTATQVAVDQTVVGEEATVLTVRVVAVGILTGTVHERIFAGATMRIRLSRLLLLFLLLLQHSTAIGERETN